MKDYFSYEQLERQVLVTRAEIRQIRRKILIQTIVTSFFLVYFWRFSLEMKMLMSWLTIPLVINALTWQLWIALVLRRAIARSSSYADEERHFDPDQLSDEYRAQRFYLARLNRQEAIFDVLTGIQFMVVALCFVTVYFLGWW